MIEVVGLGRAAVLPGGVAVPAGLADALGVPPCAGLSDGMRIGLLGSPETGDPSFVRLKEEAAARGISLQVRWGEPLPHALFLPPGRTVFGGGQALPGDLLLPGGGPFEPRRHGLFNPDEELLVFDDLRQAGRAVRVSDAEGTPFTALSAIHRRPGAAPGAASQLTSVVAALRSESGCPWDRAQDHLSLRRYILEEAAEAIDAIEGGDAGKIRDELGDLLLQVVLQARLYEEEGAFDFADVAAGLAEKLIRRHPHVFGEEEAKDAREVERVWAEVKAREAAGKPRALVDEVPRSLPAFERLCHMLRLLTGLGIDIGSLPLPASGVVREAQALIRAGQEPSSAVRDAALLLEAGLAAVDEARGPDRGNAQKWSRDGGKAAFFLGIEAKLAGKKKD